MRRLVPCDDGSRSPGVELVAEADLDLVLVQLPTGGRERRQANARQRSIRDIAEIRVAVFAPNRPIVGDGIFDAAADRPPNAGVRKARGRTWNAGEEPACVGDAAIKASEGDAAGGIEQGAIPGDAEAAANRTLDV